MIRQVLGVSAVSFALAAGITATAGPTSAAPGIYCGQSSAGASVYAGPGTSCGFALNTAEGYHANGPGPSFSVTSPATGMTYLMSCSGSAVCRGGNDALVYMRP